MSIFRALFCGLVAAIGPQVASGPEVGASPRPFQVAAITGDHSGETVDATTDRGAKATVYVFVQADKWDRPMARFLKTLDKELEADPKLSDVRTVAVWLGDDATKSKDYLPRAQLSLQLAKTDLTVFDGDRFGPVGWSISPEAHLTAVVVRDGKVAARFGHVSVNETDVPAVMKSLKPSP